MNPVNNPVRTHVIVKSKPNCVACNQTKRFLDRHSVPYVEKTITPEEATHYRAIGFMAAPVVITPDDVWAGFNPDKLTRLVSE